MHCYRLIGQRVRARTFITGTGGEIRDISRLDNAGLLATALLAGRAFDVGELEELPARVGEASCLQDEAWPALGSIQLAVLRKGIGLQNA